MKFNLGRVAFIGLVKSHCSYMIGKGVVSGCTVKGRRGQKCL